MEKDLLVFGNIFNTGKMEEVQMGEADFTPHPKYCGGEEEGSEQSKY